MASWAPTPSAGIIRPATIDRTRQNVEGCWNCGSPLHHRAACTENIPISLGEEIRRNLKRYQDAMNPAPESTGAFSLSMPIQQMDHFLNESSTTYSDADDKLTMLGRPPIDEQDAEEFYLKHKQINLQLFLFRRKDDKMCPTLRKAPASQFGSADQWVLFTQKVETVAQMRSAVWQKSCKFLVWGRMAIQLSRNRKAIRDSLKDWVNSACHDVEGRPDKLLEAVVTGIPAKRMELAELESATLELRRICKAEDVDRLDDLLRLATTKVDGCAQKLHKLKDDIDRKAAIDQAKEEFHVELRTEFSQLELETKRLEDENRKLDDMIKCGICAERIKEMMLPCNHMFCEPCISNLENNSAGVPEMVVSDEPGIDGEPLIFYENPTRPVCPLC